MIIRVFDDHNSLAGAAASQAAAAIRTAIALRGRARIVAATGASQFAFLEALTSTPASIGSAWSSFIWTNISTCR